MSTGDPRDLWAYRVTPMPSSSFPTVSVTPEWITQLKLLNENLASLNVKLDAIIEKLS